MEYIENKTHLVEVIEGKESIIGRKYKKIDIGLLWIEDRTIFKVIEWKNHTEIVRGPETFQEFLNER